MKRAYCITALAACGITALALSASIWFHFWPLGSQDGTAARAKPAPRPVFRSIVEVKAYSGSTAQIEQVEENREPLTPALVSKTDAYRYWISRAKQPGNQQLAEDEIQELVQWLNRRAWKSLTSSSDRRALVNDVMWLIGRQSELAPSYVDALIGLANDDQVADGVLKEYALQHLAASHSRIDLGSDARDRIVETLRKHATNPASQSSGVAILGLHALDHPRIDQVVVETLGSPSICQATRVTCLQIAKERRLEGAAIHARKALSRPDASTVVKLAAIGALSDVGQSIDRPLLETLTAGQHRLIAASARQALQNLSSSNR